MKFSKLFFVFLLLNGISIYAHKEKQTKNVATAGFELNKGQWPQQVIYKTDISGCSRLFLEKDKFTYVLTNEKELTAIHEALHKDPKNRGLRSSPVHAHAFQMKFEGSNPDARISSTNQLPHYYNYFKGNDPSKWAGNVPAFSSLKYENLYDGIDVALDLKGPKLKYNYIVKAGHDAGQIKLLFEGTDKLFIENNQLHIVTSAGEIIESRPYSYQIINGREVEVPCQFSVDEETNTVSFVLPIGYDKNFDLIIDPVVLVASTYSGSTAVNYGHCATYDQAGNIFTGAENFGQGYPVTPGAFQSTFAGGVDIAISKLNPTGSNLIYATYLGGSNDDLPHSMFADSNDQLFVYGSTQSFNYPTTAGCYDNTFNGANDIIVSKFNSAGTSLLGSTYIGGSSDDGVSNLATNYGDDYRGEIIVSSNGEVFINSNTQSPNFPVTAGAYDVTYNGSQDAVIMKLNGGLNNLLLSTFLGGSQNETGYGIRLSTCGDIYITGITEGGNFPSTPGALNTSYLGGALDGYVAHFNSSLSSLINCTFFGTSSDDVSYFIDMDVNNNVYIYGISSGSIPVSPGVYSNAGGQNFVAKLNPSLSTVNFSTVFGTPGSSLSCSAFLVDIYNNIYMAGWGPTNGYTVTLNAAQLTTDGQDFYLIALSPNAAGLNYATYFGSPTEWEHVDGGTSRFDPRGIVYQAVCEGSANFPVTPGAYSPNNNTPSYDITVFKIDFGNGLGPVITNTATCHGNSVSITGVVPTGLGNLTWSIQPGGNVSNAPTFTITPGSTTTYTIFSTGTTCSAQSVTQTNTVLVTVYPSPALSPTLNNLTCTNNTNSVNLGISFLPGGSPGYTVTWSPPPSTFVAVNSSTASGLTPGVESVTVTTANGCKATATMNVLPQPPTFTFSVTGVPVITCANPSVNLSANSNYTFGTLSYTWSSLAFTANTSSVIISQQGTVNVFAIDPLTQCSASQIVTVTTNTVMPTNSVNPITQVITCASVSPVTFTGAAITPTVNLMQSWYSPVNPPPVGPPMSTCGTSVCPMILTSPGTYSFVTCDLLNGCCNTKTVSITSLSGFPTYNTSSTTNYSVGCTPLNQTTLSIINPVSTNTPQGTCVYAFLAPSYTGAPAFATAPNSTVTQIPGTWTVIVKDQSNNCQTTVYIPIIQNTVAPNVSANMVTQTLTCYNPTLLANGTSTTPFATVQWEEPVAPTLVSTSTIIIGPGTGPNTSSTSLVYANYTVVATNSVNACITTSVIPIYQNFKPPVSSPMISIGTPTAIYCHGSMNPAVLTTGASTTTSGGGPTAFAVPLLWAGPSPQTTVTGASSYSAYVAGIYSLTIMDNYNGCTTTGTINMLDKTQPPVITTPHGDAIIDCGKDTAGLLINITGLNNGLKYYFTHHPMGAAFNPTSAVIPYGPDPDLNGTSSSTIYVNMPGTYEYFVTNTLTGCKAAGSYYVGYGSLTASFTPQPEEGFAPLPVSFQNNSYSSSGSSSIISVWSFGNGSSQTSTAGLASTTYSAPGTYTIALITVKGKCIDTVYKTVKVDLPSKLEVPNVFTPNGDGSNDVFFLKTANLGSISAIIFDRWGNRVYEVNSYTGNIAWDGKNPQGRECAQGVYLYIIKALGNDSKNYEFKGNISLFR